MHVDENYDDEPLRAVVAEATPMPTSVTWVSGDGGVIPAGAVMGGFDNENLYVGRAQHEGGLVPGKVLSSHGVCYIAWGGAEHSKPEYEVSISFSFSLSAICHVGGREGTDRYVCWDWYQSV